MKSILLVGAGNFGLHIAKELNSIGQTEVLAIDRNESKINEILPYVDSALIGDSTNINFLKTLGIDNFDVCIVTIDDDFQGSLETTYLLKENGAKRVISRATHEVQAKFLKSNGADSIVYPDKQLARWLAVSCCSNHLHNYIELDDEYSLYEVDIPSRWDNKSLYDLNVRNKFNLNVLAIKENEKMNFNIDPLRKFKKGETILVLSTYENIKNIFKI